jgi:hypothetical protein
MADIGRADKEIMEMPSQSLDVRIQNTQGNREAYRTSIPGMHVQFMDSSQVHLCRDISPTGIGIENSPEMREGQEVRISLFYEGIVVASNLSARVVRVSPTQAGLSFVGLTRHQSNAVHAIVLEEQKRQVELRKQEHPLAL